jgi:hypothetical protein
VRSQRKQKAAHRHHAPRPLSAERYSPQVARSQSSRGNFLHKMYFASLTLSPWESKRKPASSNTSAYIIHGSRLIGGVKGPRALVGSPRINGATAATEKYHRLPPLRMQGGIRGAAPRRGASLAKTGAVFAQHPAGGRAG